MKCEKCNDFIYFDKEYQENILNKYLLIFEKSSYRELDPKIYVLYEHLIEYIKENENLEVFRNLTNQINDEIVINCESCGFDNKINYSFVIANEFYAYINRYIEFIFDNIITKYTNRKLHDFSIYINEQNIDILFENLPKYFVNDKNLLKKLYHVRNIIPETIEKGGGGLELIEWLVDEFKVQIFGIMLSLIITGGIGQIKKLVNNIKIKYEIKKRIKLRQKYWSDISIEDIKKYISLPKGFRSSKEKLVEQILKIKFEEYKKEIIEKLRYVD